MLISIPHVRPTAGISSSDESFMITETRGEAAEEDYLAKNQKVLV
jgi:hypothetical protein